MDSENMPDAGSSVPYGAGTSTDEALLQEHPGGPHGPSWPLPAVFWRRGSPKNSTGPAAWARFRRVANRIPPGSITWLSAAGVSNDALRAPAV